MNFLYVLLNLRDWSFEKSVYMVGIAAKYFLSIQNGSLVCCSFHKPRPAHTITAQYLVRSDCLMEGQFLSCVMAYTISSAALQLDVNRSDIFTKKEGWTKSPPVQTYSREVLKFWKNTAYSAQCYEHSRSHCTNAVYCAQCYEYSRTQWQ